MAKLKLLSTIFSKLGSLTKNNGQIIVTRDSKSLYVDLEGERIEITDWIDVDTEETLLSILTPLTNKYYYTKDSNKIWRYVNSEWICLNNDINDQSPTYTESTSLVGLSSGEKISVSFGKISKAITDLISHIDNSAIHITSSERTNWNSAKTHADSTHARTDATKVEKSSTNGNIKINGTETTVYTHPSGTNPHGTTKSDVGLGNVGNFKAVSTVANQGLTDTEKSNARANIGAGTSSFSGSYNDLTNKPTIPSVGNGTITIKQNGTTKGTFTTNQSGNTTIELTDDNTTYSTATSSANGLMSKDDKVIVDRLNRESLSLVPRGTAIGANQNLNTINFIKVGKYYCSTDVTVKTLTNCPATEAFMMEVFSPLSTTYDNETTSQWVYRLRKITTYTGHMYIQMVNSGSTAGTFTYGTWHKMYSELDKPVNTWIAFKGATATSNGTAGYVPAPTMGNQDKFFRADGTWATLSLTWNE